jgi:hypothetical protein
VVDAIRRRGETQVHVIHREQTHKNHAYQYAAICSIAIPCSTPARRGEKSLIDLRAFGKSDTRFCQSRIEYLTAIRSTEFFLELVVCRCCRLNHAYGGASDNAAVLGGLFGSKGRTTLATRPRSAWYGKSTPTHSHCSTYNLPTTIFMR